MTFEHAGIVSKLDGTWLAHDCIEIQR